MNSLSPIRAPRSERRCNQPNARGAFSLSIRKSADGGGWWTGLDLNQRRENPADLQSAAIDRLATRPWGLRPEQHTSELQSLLRISDAGFGVNRTQQDQTTDANQS